MENVHFSIVCKFSMLFNGKFASCHFPMLFNGKFAFCHLSMFFNRNLRIEKDQGGDVQTYDRTDGQTDVRKFTPVSYRTSALWGRFPALTQLPQLITPSRALGTADHVRSLDDLFHVMFSHVS